MRKIVAALALSLAVAAANADTVTLFPTSGFGNLDQFWDIPNDGGIARLVLVVSYYGAQQMASLSAVDESGNSLWQCNGPAEQTVNCSDNVPRLLTFAQHSVTIRPKVCSGRGGCAPRTHWYLDSGTIVMN